jgi:hypothetical protein
MKALERSMWKKGDQVKAQQMMDERLAKKAGGGGGGDGGGAAAKAALPTQKFKLVKMAKEMELDPTGTMPELTKRIQEAQGS